MKSEIFGGAIMQMVLPAGEGGEGVGVLAQGDYADVYLPSQADKIKVQI